MRARIDAVGRQPQHRRSHASSRRSGRAYPGHPLGDRSGPAESQASRARCSVSPARHLAGIVLGIVGAFASQVLDPCLRRESQLRRLTRLPISARIPREPGRGKPSPRGTSSTAAGGLQGPAGDPRLREPVASWARPGSWCTGLSPGEGKSTTAINLAFLPRSLRQASDPIEADLHRPSVGSSLGLEAEHDEQVSVLIERPVLEDAL